MDRVNAEDLEPVIPKIDESPARVLIVEDHELLAESLALALRIEGMDVAVSTGPTADDVLEAAARMEPQVVLLDLQLGDRLGDGRTLVAPLHELGPRVVMLSGSMTRRALAECVEAGSSGFVDKAQPFEVLLAALRRVIAEDRLLTAGERTELLLELRKDRAEEEVRLAAFERLTPREAGVLAGLLEGHGADRIAAEACVAPTTVRSQIRAILQKLGVNSQLSAVALARHAGWSPEAHPAS